MIERFVFYFDEWQIEGIQSNSRIQLIQENHNNERKNPNVLPDAPIFLC